MHGKGSFNSLFIIQRYEGEFKNGKKSGFGVYFYNNGNKYFGEWQNDDYNGEGTLVNRNGAIYKGKFKMGAKWGIGTEISNHCLSKK